MYARVCRPNCRNVVTFMHRYVLVLQWVSSMVYAYVLCKWSLSLDPGLMAVRCVCCGLQYTTTFLVPYRRCVCVCVCVCVTYLSPLIQRSSLMLRVRWALCVRCISWRQWGGVSLRLKRSQEREREREGVRYLCMRDRGREKGLKKGRDKDGDLLLLITASI